MNTVQVDVVNLHPTISEELAREIGSMTDEQLKELLVGLSAERYRAFFHYTMDVMEKINIECKGDLRKYGVGWERIFGKRDAGMMQKQKKEKSVSRADGVATAVLKLRISEAEKARCVATAKNRKFADVSSYVRWLIRMAAARAYRHPAPLFLDPADVAEMEKEFPAKHAK